MNNKGMAISSILYTILILFLALLFGILGLISSAKTTFDSLKEKLYMDINNNMPDVLVSANTDDPTKLNLTISSRKYIDSYYITSSNDIPDDQIRASGIKLESPSATISFIQSPDSPIYYLYLKDIHDNLYKYKVKIDASGPKDPYTFRYTGDIQEFVAPADGVYKLEVWGAQGGVTYAYGEGGYATGSVELKRGEKLYVVVGGKGSVTSTLNGSEGTAPGGYNGGGDARVKYNTDDGKTRYAGSGGGATHIATKTGLLKDLESEKGPWDAELGVYRSETILIVAGGGGGCVSIDSYRMDGEAGGGYYGGFPDNSAFPPSTQWGPGTSNASFGQGASASLTATQVLGGAGGGGWFGGGKTDSIASAEKRGGNSGGGGSGYIGSPRLFNKKMVGGAMRSTKTETYTELGSCCSGSPTSNCYKSGDGFAKITYEGVKASVIPIVNDSSCFLTGTCSNGPTVVLEEDKTYIGIAYLDPTDLSASCRASNLATNSYGKYGNVKSGCMKWYIYKQTDEKYTMIADHNVYNNILWAPDTPYEKVTYENSYAKVLVDELVTKEGWQVTPRLISGSEIYQIIGKTNSFNPGTSGSIASFYSGTVDADHISPYHWLYDNLASCRSYGCSVGDGTYYTVVDVGSYLVTCYYTSNNFTGWQKVYVVTNQGKIDLGSYGPTEYNKGIRPVITVNKSIFNK